MFLSSGERIPCVDTNEVKLSPQPWTECQVECITFVGATERESCTAASSLATDGTEKNRRGAKSSIPAYVYGTPVALDKGVCVPWLLCTAARTSSTRRRCSRFALAQCIRPIFRVLDIAGGIPAQQLQRVHCRNRVRASCRLLCICICTRRSQHYNTFQFQLSPLAINWMTASNRVIIFGLLGTL